MTAAKTTDRARQGGEKPLVILALEPRSYAQAIGQTFALLRPNLEVLVVEPEDLSAEMGRRQPAVVLCSEERPDGCSDAVRWARFRPYEEPEVVRVDGLDEGSPGFDLGDLLGLVDRLAVGAGRG